MADETTPAVEADGPLPFIEHEAEQVAETVVAEVSDIEQRIARAVTAWRDTHLTNSPVSREPQCWTHIDSVLPHLTALILKEI